MDRRTEQTEHLHAILVRQPRVVVPHGSVLLSLVDKPVPVLRIDVQICDAEFQQFAPAVAEELYRRLVCVDDPAVSIRNVDSIHGLLE